VIVTRNVDLSIGSVLGISAYTAGTIFVDFPHVWVPLVFLIGTGVGLAAIVWGEWLAGNRSPVYGLLLATLGFHVYAIWKRVSRGSVPAPGGPV